MNSEFKVIERPIPPEDFVRLRKIAGLSDRDLDAAKKALPKSIYGVHISHREKTIAMGRIVGDGYLNFEIVDVAVDPEHQGEGLGRAIMEKIMAFLEHNAPKGSCISLMADEPEFYTRFGFALSRPECEGMFLKRSK